MIKIEIENLENDLRLSGLFSEYLPLNFSLASQRNDIFSMPISNDTDFVEPLHYTMSRFSDTASDERRVISIPEITSYIRAVKYITEEKILDDFIRYTDGNSHSFSSLIDSEGKLTKCDKDYNLLISGRLSKGTLHEVGNYSTYIANMVNKINTAQGAIGILYLDISNFYGSIYTHLIPSITIGVDRLNIEYKLYLANQQDTGISNTYRKYRKLDELTRNMNAGRTNGLLVGPYISRLIAESLLTRIDRDLENEGLNFTRYMDDYEVYINDDKDIDLTKIKVSTVLQKYFLSINNEKTKFIRFPYYLFTNLQRILESYDKTDKSSTDIIKLFNEFFVLESSGVKGSIRYLIKCIMYVDVPDDKKLYTTYLMNVLTNNNRSISEVCQTIITNSKMLTIDQQSHHVLSRLLKSCIKNKNDLEVVWLLYLLKNIGCNSLHPDLVMSIITSNNDLAIIILLHEFRSSLSEKMIKTCKASAKSWILLYQLFYLDIITFNEFRNKSMIKKNLSFYKKLKYNKFTFYKDIESINRKLLQEERTNLLSVLYARLAKLH